LGAEDWGKLELVDRMTSERVRQFVRPWPDSEVIEVRSCACGQALARKVGGTSPVANADGARAPRSKAC
jgi:hypothetical protein